MITREHYYYYQPTHKITGELPSRLEEYWGIGLFSFCAFASEEDCRNWLELMGFNPDDFNINEYKDDDIEGVTILSGDGSGAIPAIDDYPDDELFDGMMDNILEFNHDIETFEDKRGEGESQQEYEDRLYGTAHAIVMNEVERMEESGWYNFAAYGGTPAVEWYDGVREDLIREVMKEMTNRS